MATTDYMKHQIDFDPPDPRISIERMQESDLEEVLKIEQVSFSMPWNRNMFATELRETTLSYPIVARWLIKPPAQDNERPNSLLKPICGYSIFWHVIDEIHIGNLAIDPNYRRLGIASALIKNIIQLGQQWAVTRITLEVRQSNESAIRLYHQFGFREIAIRKKYYSHPVEDALVMVKNDL